jgi:hypothetical protein
VHPEVTIPRLSVRNRLLYFPRILIHWGGLFKQIAREGPTEDILIRCRNPLGKHNGNFDSNNPHQDIARDVYVYPVDIDLVDGDSEFTASRKEVRTFAFVVSIKWQPTSYYYVL